MPEQCVSARFVSWPVLRPLYDLASSN